MTPVSLAKELGVRPQLIYGLIRQKRVHAYGEKPQLVDIAEVRQVMAQVKHREPKEVTKGRQPARGTIIGQRTKGNVLRHRVVTGAILPSEGDPSDYTGLLHTTDTRRREDHILDAASLAGLIKGRLAKIEGPHELLGMLIYHFEEAGDEPRATALEEFAIQVLEITPYKFMSVGDDPKALGDEEEA
jgi:hypothetical protein